MIAVLMTGLIVGDPVVLTRLVGQAHSQASQGEDGWLADLGAMDSDSARSQALAGSSDSWNDCASGGRHVGLHRP